MAITIGKLTNVPNPGSPITSPWAQDVTRLGVHVFATKAALDAASTAPNWPGLADGALATTVDTSTLWQRIAGTWKSLSTGTGVTGTWDPVTGLGSTPNIAKTINEAKYILQGNLCNFWFDMTFTGASAGMSALSIALPFAAVGHSNFAVMGSATFTVPSVPTFWVGSTALRGAASTTMGITTQLGLYGVDHLRGIVIGDVIRGNGSYRIA